MSDDLVERSYLIFKAGRGWYRPDSQGYTAFKFDAGRYSKDEAIKITHPNGLDGPRDGMLYRHESEVWDYPSDRIEELEAKLAEADMVKEAQQFFNHRAVEVLIWGATVQRLRALDAAWVNLETQSELASLQGDKK